MMNVLHLDSLGGKAGYSGDRSLVRPPQKGSFMFGGKNLGKINENEYIQYVILVNSSVKQANSSIL